MGAMDVTLITLVMMLLLSARIASAAPKKIEDTKKFYQEHKKTFTQKLDHFGSNGTSNMTFEQIYYVDYTYWEGAAARGPIFVYFGDNHAMSSMGNIGVLTESALQFKGLILYIEHRFYGESIPLGSIDRAMADPEVRRCLTTKQALADFAAIVTSYKKNASAILSPVIVLGDYYSGMLAVWFRLKFPNIAIGALASSSPMLLFDSNFPKDGYCEIVSKAFQDYDTKCYGHIMESWAELDIEASKPKGLETLGQLFNTCRPLESSLGLKKLLAQVYTMTVQIGDPNNYVMNRLCEIMSNYPGLKGIAAAALDFLYASCIGIPNYLSLGPPFDTYRNVSTPWGWQRCTELVLPISCGNTPFLPPHHFDLTLFSEECRTTYGVSPDPHSIATQYQGQDVRATLKKSASNIIFSNGLRDPTSFGGILEDVSDSVVAIVTREGHMTQDLDLEEDQDPAWLTRQRKEELKVFGRWINKGRPKLVPGLSFVAILALFFL